MKKPFISVVMATFGRGKHIRPSVLSVLQQDYGAFELIVVGDNCTDSTETVVAGFNDEKLRWINLPSRCGSQSAPNNAGIEAARGDIIAYIGHDDVWEANHLSSLVALFAKDPALDFAVAGLIYHLPNGIPGSQVTGLFEDDSAKHEHFFPPSSIAHKKTVCEQIGFWRMPFDIRAPVDCDFLLRAAKADLCFASTGAISVHKFAAGHRYLSYLKHDSHEQSDMLSAMKQSQHECNIIEIVEESKMHKAYMIIGYLDFDLFERGELAQQNASRKGIVQQAEAFPNNGVVMKHTQGYFALDWQDKPDENIRWSARNPCPKMLIAYTGEHDVRCSFRAYHDDRNALKRLTLNCNGLQISSKSRNQKRKDNLWSAKFSVRFKLDTSEMTVLQFLLDDKQAPLLERRGIGLGSLTIAPTKGFFGQILNAFKR